MPSAEMNQDEGLMPPPLEVDSSTTLSSSASHSGATQTAPTESSAEAPCGGVPQTPAPSAPPLVPMRVKPLRPDDGDAECAGTVVQMSLIRDLRLRIDKRTLVAEELAGLGPEMAKMLSCYFQPRFSTSFASSSQCWRRLCSRAAHARGGATAIL